MFAALNVFNLLPFYPLDGGRFLQDLLFSRNRYLEAVFRVILGGLTVLVGLAMGAWILAGVGGFVILFTGMAFKTSRAAAALRRREGFPDTVSAETLTPAIIAATREELGFAPAGLRRAEGASAPQAGRRPGLQARGPSARPGTRPGRDEGIATEDVPTPGAAPGDRVAARTAAARWNARDRSRGKPKSRPGHGTSPAGEAAMIWEAWEKYNARPAGCLATVALLLVCALTLVAAVAAPVTYGLLARRTEVAEFRRPDGSTGRREVARTGAIALSEIEVNEMNLYHGVHSDYRFGPERRKNFEARWHEGWLDGEMKVFDGEGKVAGTLVFQKGELAAIRDHTGPGVVERRPDDMPEWQKVLWREHKAKGPWGPGRSMSLPPLPLGGP
jgi:hypothetical protein